MSALIKQKHYHMEVEGRSRSVIQDCGCDREEGRLSWEVKAEEVSFEVLPKRCNRGTISYMERERVNSGPQISNTETILLIPLVQKLEKKI